MFERNIKDVYKSQYQLKIVTSHIPFLGINNRWFFDLNIKSFEKVSGHLGKVSGHFPENIVFHDRLLLRNSLKSPRKCSRWLVVILSSFGEISFGKMSRNYPSGKCPSGESLLEENCLEPWGYGKSSIQFWGVAWEQKETEDITTFLLWVLHQSSYKYCPINLKGEKKHHRLTHFRVLFIELECS